MGLSDEGADGTMPPEFWARTAPADTVCGTVARDIHVIEKAEYVAIHHLTDTNNDRCLHLERVEPRYLVLGQLPNLTRTHILRFVELIHFFHGYSTPG